MREFLSRLNGRRYQRWQTKRELRAEIADLERICSRLVSERDGLRLRMDVISALTSGASVTVEREDDGTFVVEYDD